METGSIGQRTAMDAEVATDVVEVQVLSLGELVGHGDFSQGVPKSNMGLECG